MRQMGELHMFIVKLVEDAAQPLLYVIWSVTQFEPIAVVFYAILHIFWLLIAYLLKM